MTGVRDHVDLDVYQLSEQVRERLKPILARPGFQRDFKLRDQLNARAEGPPAHIAEGFSRYGPRDFARFLRIAKGSLSEVVQHLKVAEEQGLATAQEAQEIGRLARRARGAAIGLICYLDSAEPPDNQE